MDKLKDMQDKDWGDKNDTSIEYDPMDASISFAIKKFEEEMYELGDDLFVDEHHLPYTVYPFIHHNRFYNTTKE